MCSMWLGTVSIAHAMLIWNNANTIVALFPERDDKKEKSKKKVRTEMQVSAITLFRRITLVPLTYTRSNSP